MSFIGRTSILRPNGVTPLSDEDIRRVAPSAFAGGAHESRSARYTYIPTAEVIRGMRDAGFLPMAAGQARTRDEGRRGHTKHMLRFRHVDARPMAERRVGQTFPEIVLLNSHDGTSAYRVMSGVFRLVCLNGMIVTDRALSRWPALAGTNSSGEAGGMPSEPTTYPGYRFPAEVIQHAVWLYHLFSLSLRDIELILAERGVVVSYESIRRWCLRFGTEFAAKLRKRRPRPGDTWHMDEVYLKINGELFYLWRAVDQHGVVLDILVQERRNATAAKRFFKRLLVGLQYRPRKIVTDGLRSYGVAQREVLPGVQHRTSRYLNNRAENSHRPTRRRERAMRASSQPGKPSGFCRRTR